MVAELDSANNVVARYVYGTKANVPEYIVKGDTTYKIISDHLGSVRLVVNISNGKITQQMNYDAWGNQVSNLGSNITSLSFAGGLTDEHTGLVRFGARDYNPTIGRWINKDPIGFGGGVSNLYEYCVNDPVNFVDLNGIQTIIITTFDSNLGSHSAIWVGNDGDGYEAIYDPAGSYGSRGNDRRGNSGIILSENYGLLDHYLNYQKGTGSELKLLLFKTSIRNQQSIINQALEQGDIIGGFCANYTGGALKGSSYFSSLDNNYWLPGSLYDDLKELLNKIKKNEGGCK